MRRRRPFIVLAVAISIVTAAKGGHESPVYPSYYPHEIELASVTPERAGDLLLAGKIQAYIGGAPRFAKPPPDSISYAESLGSFVIVRVNPASPFVKDARSACALAETVVRDLAAKGGDLVVHPFPVTPLHGDYLHYVDLADAAKARVLGSHANLPASDIQNLRVTNKSTRAAQGSDWDVEVAEVDAAQLIAAASYSMNSWLGPAWIRSGWFHALLLLGGQADEEDRKQVQRLQMDDYADAVERINLERSLVSTLAAGCREQVAGYTVKREYYSTVFTAGVENIAYDSVTGFNSPMFIRTVKLKDFPWNGWLALGIDAVPTAGWNPIAGFTDNFGRLMWSAVGDAALIPSPNETAWMLNRISDVQSSAKR
jgi:hypothetical protein